MWTWVFGFLGVLLVLYYVVMAVGCWYFEAMQDGYFTGEGDGFNRAQRRRRIGSAARMPFMLLGDFAKRTFLAAIGR